MPKAYTAAEVTALTQAAQAGADQYGATAIVGAFTADKGVLVAAVYHPDHLDNVRFMMMTENPVVQTRAAETPIADQARAWLEANIPGSTTAKNSGIRQFAAADMASNIQKLCNVNAGRQFIENRGRFHGVPNTILGQAAA
jgi:hypothetical protein